MPAKGSLKKELFPPFIFLFSTSQFHQAENKPYKGTMLHIQNLQKAFTEKSIIADLSLKVHPNSFTVIVGPSGCGKSTLFQTITGIVKRDNGTIYFKNKTVLDLMKIAAYMQQKDLLLPWLSLFENAMLPATTSGHKNQKNINKCLDYLKHFKLDKDQHYLPHQVSGGMKQRCALARTLMFNRELILLDEPLSALDAITRRNMQKMLLTLQSKYDKTILMITHDIEEALLLADDLYLVTNLPMRIAKHYQLKSDKPRRFNDEDLLNKKQELIKLLGDNC
ncbi:MAG: ABC transporter ATP-binding protein [Desulfotalea sp.]